MKVGILFDLDGTLLNTLTDLHRAVNYVLRQNGCPERSVQEVRRFVGNGARRLIEQALPAVPSDAQVDGALEVFHIYYNATCSRRKHFRIDFSACNRFNKHSFATLWVFGF